MCGSPPGVVLRVAENAPQIACEALRSTGRSSGKVGEPTVARVLGGEVSQHGAEVVKDDPRLFAGKPRGEAGCQVMAVFGGKHGRL